MPDKKPEKIIICGIIFLIIISATTPIINANIIKTSESKEETTCLGCIYGHTGISHIWGFSPVRFAIVTAGCRITISGPIMGEYKIKGLPLGKLTVTGSKRGYKTYTTTVTLTEEYPKKQVFIDLQPVDDDKTSNKNTEKTNNNPFNFGIIIGATMWAKGWCCGPLGFARVHATGENYEKNRISGFFGNFILIIPITWLFRDAYHLFLMKRQKKL